jgi:hypothetical protein
MDYVVRDVDVVSVKGTVNAGPAVNADGKTLNIYQVNAGSKATTQNGQPGSEYSTLNAATAVAKQAGDIVYAQYAGTTGLTNTADNPTQADAVQILGGGTTVTVYDSAGTPYTLFTGNTAQQTLVTGFGGGAIANFNGNSGTFAGFNATVPDVATSTAVTDTITTDSKTVTIKDNTITAANPGATANSPIGVSITAGTGGTKATAVYANNTIAGFGGAGTTSAVVNKAIGTTGSLTVNSSGNTFGTTAAANRIGFENRLGGTATTTTLTFNDNNSTYVNNTGASILVGTPSANGAAAGNINATITNPTITFTSGFGIQISNTQAGGTAATVLKASVVGGKITSTGAGNPTAIGFFASGQTVAGSSATLSVNNGLVITGNGAGGTSTGIEINRGGANQGTVTATVDKVSFSGNQGTPNANPQNALGANIHIDDTTAAGVTSNITISNNTFQDAGAANTYSILWLKNSDNNSVTTVQFSGNKMTGSTTTMQGLTLGLSTAPTATSLNTMLLNNFNNNTITNYSSGLIVTNSPAANVAAITVGTGNSVTGSNSGFNLNRATANAQNNVTVNGQTVVGNIPPAVTTQFGGLVQ